MLTDAQVAEIKARAEHNYNRADIDKLLADRDELVRRLAKVEAAAIECRFAVCQSDHGSTVTRCPCGYAQLRAALGPAAPAEGAG